ncbi:MAG: hypothetical protein N2445_04270 [Acidobacteria bacterium]|nr:hypothetical protein [Acidobacteriota bacterium]
MPSDVPISAVFDRIGMLETLKRISNVSDVKTKAVYFSFKADGSIHIETRNEEGDKGEEFFTCESYTGDEVKLSLNGDYFIDFLSSVPDEKVQIKMKNSESQCLFEPVREDDSSVCKNVAMPLRTE